MARRRSRLRPGVWTITLTAWNVYRRLPPKQRKQLVGAVRKHGPRIAAGAYKATRRKK